MNEHNANNVVVKSKDTTVEIHPEYLYLTIPAEYVCTYHKLLVYMADFGRRLIDDCTAMCKGNNKTVVDCWNLFQSAISCHALEMHKEAKLFIDYINKQLDNIYRGEDKKAYNGTNYYPITPDGVLKALCSCGSDVKFEVDVETGKLYQEYLDNKDNGEVFTVEGNDLVVKSSNKV